MAHGLAPAVGAEPTVIGRSHGTAFQHHHEWGIRAASGIRRSNTTTRDFGSLAMTFSLRHDSGLRLDGSSGNLANENQLESDAPPHEAQRE